VIAGAEFLKIFQFPMIEGNADNALKDPGSIVLTQSTAKALLVMQKRLTGWFVLTQII